MKKMIKINIIFFPIFIANTVVARYGLFGEKSRPYMYLTIGVLLSYILVRGEVFRKWIISEYPEVADKKGGLRNVNMAGILFILNYNDGDRRLHGVKWVYVAMNTLAFLWAFYCIAIT